MAENDGRTLEQLKDDPMVLEHALLRVRQRHEAAGDADKLTLKDLLREARLEVAVLHDRAARGQDFTTRYSLGKRVKKLDNAV